MTPEQGFPAGSRTRRALRSRNDAGARVSCVITARTDLMARNGTAWDGGAVPLSHGNVTVIWVPLPSSLLRSIFASWKAAACLTIASPSPVPPFSRLRPLSTR